MTEISKERDISASEYLAREERSGVRHEYVNGQVFAMTGSTRRHIRITRNLTIALTRQLEGSPCEVFTNELKVHIEAANSFYYPDLVVECGAGESDGTITSNPILIVEVTSRSTQATDRREKAAAYRQIASLREYLIVSHRKRYVELHRRTASGWELYRIPSPAEIVLTSLPGAPFRLDWDEIYKDADVPSGPFIVGEGDAGYGLQGEDYFDEYFE